MSATAERLTANKQLVLDYFRDVAAAFNIDAVPQYTHEDYVAHGPDPLHGITELQEYLRGTLGGQAPLDPRTVQVLTPTFALAEGDRVTVCYYMPRIEPEDPERSYDFFSFNTFRIAEGKIIERWPNVHKYAPPQHPSDPSMGRERATNPRHLGSTDLAANKTLVTKLYVEVFGPMNAAKVKDFVTEDYFQHASHMPRGRAGLEAFVADLATHAPPPPGPDAPPMPPPAVLVAEGDMVVIAGELPQPLRDDSGGTWTYYAYDAYRIHDGKLSEHWSGIDKHNRPQVG